MDKLNERIGYIIEHLGMTKTAFAEHLNVSQAFVSQLCSGVKQPSERTLLDICREFKINYLWLTEEKGDMFTATPESVVDELAEDFNLDDIDKKIIESYLKLNESQRAVIKEYIKLSLIHI